MLTTIEAEIETDGSVRLLEPLRIKKKSRAIVTILEDGGANGGDRPLNTKGGVRELFGSVNLGYPTGSDNESIDADLAKEYSDTHEGQN